MTASPTAYHAALYMRLSKDDEGTAESSSITNQRNMLITYAKEHGFPIAAEFVDDGFAGTNFDRPGFRRMIEAIEGKKINLILTKDLSRLGRDYIQTGQYTEVYFPAKQVRYIAINDGFDSASPYTDIAPFKNVVNEMYARDTSQKIRSAFSVKMRSGSYIGSFAPYGYEKDPADKNHLIPDQLAAAVVVEIFNQAAAGCSPGQIAKVLNDRAVLSPAQYRCSKHPTLKEHADAQRTEWSGATVAKLLRNMVYLGHMVQGKTTKVSFKSKLTIRNPRCDWVVVEHTHQPLVTAAQFDAAQRRMKARTCEKQGQFSNLFSGIARCADCGRAMSTVGTRKKGSPANLACGGYKLYGREACSNHFIDYNALYRIVLDAVRAELRLPDRAQEELSHQLCIRLDAEADKSGGPHPPERLRAELSQVDRIIEQLYDDNLTGRIDTERFYKLLQKYEFRGKELAAQLDALEHPTLETVRVQSPPATPARVAALMARYTEPSQLDPDLLFALIDHIEIGQGRYESTPQGRFKRQCVDIYFRFATTPQNCEVWH